MAALLRRIVASPRAEHGDTGLDLCYVTSKIIATSGPSQSYPQLAYRNPLDRLVAFLDARHGKDWAIWEFRAEGTGYPDEAVYGRIRHYPWPDHHPPPFRLVPLIVEGMRQWMAGGDSDGDEKTKTKLETRTPTTKHNRVVVVHCKAGKGRSGTMACSYLIAECGWTAQEALARFTARRMRPGFGSGVSIPSQQRYVGYVERWARPGRKRYVDRPVEIVEIHVWGLRHGVKLAVEGYADEGKRIQTFHTFAGDERFIVQGDAPGGSGFVALVADIATGGETEEETEAGAETARGIQELQGRPTLVHLPASSELPRQQSFRYAAQDEPGGRAVIFRPKTPIHIPNSDVNIAIERRNRTAPNIMGLTMVTSVAHVWFNAFFEGNGPEQDGKPDDSGVFAIDWTELDGIKGSRQKGSRAADRLAVVWRVVEVEGEKTKKEARAEGKEEEEGENEKEGTEMDKSKVVPQMQPADWRGSKDPPSTKRLGLRMEDPGSVSVSRASSIREGTTGGSNTVGLGVNPSSDTLQAVKSSGLEGEALEEASTGKK